MAVACLNGMVCKEHARKASGIAARVSLRVFLPTFSSRRRWSDRIKPVELPLFPRYVFSRFAISGRVPILKTPSVIGIVGIRATPTPIDDQEIANIQRVVKLGFGLSPHPFLQVGQRVRINNGSLSGMGIIAD
jgi:transcription antitermination factor NusG